MDNTKEFSFKEIRNHKAVKFITNNIIILILLIMALFVGIVRDNFFSFGMIKNLASNTGVRLFVALGVSGALITKGTDLSAGRIVGLSTCVAATLLQMPDAANKFFPQLSGTEPLVAMLILTVLISALFGVINGIIIAYFKVPPFIATLGTQTIVYGINLLYTGANPFGNLRKDFLALGSNEIFEFIPGLKGIPLIVVFAVIAAFIMWFLFNKTAYGKYMYAIGGNENAAEVSGINVKFMKVRIYALAGLLYGIAGILLCSKSGGSNVNLGLGWELEAIAACTIGGVSTTGGVGKVSGIIVGVLVFELLKISLQFLGVDNSLQYIVQGLVIVFAVAIDIRKYTVKK